MTKIDVLPPNAVDVAESNIDETHLHFCNLIAHNMVVASEGGKAETDGKVYCVAMDIVWEEASEKQRYSIRTLANQLKKKYRKYIDKLVEEQFSIDNAYYTPIQRKQSLARIANTFRTKKMPKDEAIVIHMLSKMEGDYDKAKVKGIKQAEIEVAEDEQTTFEIIDKSEAVQIEDNSGEE